MSVHKRPSPSQLAVTLVPLLLLAACSSGLSAEAKAACAMGTAPVTSEADRVALRARAEALSPDDVKPNKIGQFYFVLRQTTVLVPPSETLSELGLTKAQKDLSSACKSEGYSR